MSMYRRCLTLLAVCTFGSVVAARAQSPGTKMPPGTVLVGEIRGTATLVFGGQSSNPKINDPVPQAAIVRTTSDSSITLVFSNGTTVLLGPDAELVIQEFLQVPFTGAVVVASLTQEPSISRTALVLNRGELLGDVKRLRDDHGSSFAITTAAGVVDSVGGSFRLAIRIAGTGSAAFSLKATEHEVGFTAPAGKTDFAPPGRKRIVVQPGKEIGVSVQIAPNR
jgi:hypothetical protein